MLRDEFEECGYMVEFRPRQSRGSIFFRCKLPMGRENLHEFLKLLERRTGKKIVLNEDGSIPSVNNYGFMMLSPAVQRAGLDTIWKWGGKCDMEVYAAEAFAKELAAWLQSEHADKSLWTHLWQEDDEGNDDGGNKSEDWKFGDS